MAQRFLVSRLSSLGDVACTLPVAAALKANFPACEITWVVDPRFAGVVELCQHVDRVVEWKPSLRPSLWPKFETKFDAAFDMQGLIKSALPVAIAKTPTKFGYHWQRELSWLFSSRVRPDPSSFHVTDQYLDVVRAFGCEVDRAEFGLNPNDSDRDKLSQKLAERGADRPFFVINPGAAWVTKRWPATSFATVIDALSNAGYKSVLIGSKSETDREVAASVEVASTHKPVNLCGETSIRDLITLLSLSEGHLGGDTGSTHLAAALSKPAVGLYSITKPERSCPYGQRERCHYHPDSLAAIPPDAVIATIMEIISCPSSPGPKPQK